ncbi:MAG TPA: YfiR family protein [Bryobacteraceae bacterium]|nr:YfiR family protein [Bryobacteraceae bacterium]
MGVLMWRRAGCLTLSVMAGISLAAEAAAESPVAAEHSAYEIESAMLYNFTKFVEWPDKALGESGVSVVIGVLGEDGLVPVLAAALGNKTVYGHPIVVRRLVSSAEAKSCTVLFVGASDRKEIARVVQAVGTSPVLTIGGIVQFSRLGGIIAFIREGGRIRFEINLDAAERAGLQVSSKLLRLAAVWRENPPQVRN